MPDGDVFTRSVASRWRGLVSAVRDGLPPEECALRIEDGLAKELRSSGGLAHPDLEKALNAGTVDEAQVAAALGELVHRAAFERIMPLLVAQAKFATYEAAQQFMSFCVDAARMDVLARSLIRHPNGQGVRRPTRPQSSTSDLLNELAPLGGHA